MYQVREILNSTRMSGKSQGILLLASHIGLKAMKAMSFSKNSCKGIDSMPLLLVLVPKDRSWMLSENWFVVSEK